MSLTKTKNDPQNHCPLTLWYVDTSLTDWRMTSDLCFGGGGRGDVLIDVR